MKAATKIVFQNDRNEKFFGEGPCRLLREVERTGSLNRAAKSLGMAYTKALKLMRQAETELGFPLTKRTAGGKDGGGSSLTREGRSFLEKYESYRDACVEANSRLYREFFPEYGEADVKSTEPDGKTGSREDCCLFQETGLVILASGMGRRFGSNKLLADFGGVPMVRKILDASEGLFEKRVVVTRHEEVKQLCLEQKAAVLFHNLPDKNDTIRLGVEWMEKELEMKTCIFVPGDQPLLTRETLIRLGTAAAAGREKIFRTAWKERKGAPAAFPVWCFPLLKQLPKGMGGSVLMKQYPEQLKEIQAGSEWELQDADTPERLEELYNIWKTLFSAKAEDAQPSWEQEH